MNRELYKKMSMFKGLKTNDCERQELPPFVPSDSDIDRIIREIFSVDERTGLPKGDLAYYLSPDGNPTVKQWLENNLLKPRSAGGEISADLTDDLIVEFSRGSDESVSDYSARMLGYYNDAVSEFEKAKESKID